MGQQIYIHDELVRKVREAGESLIKNAESIVGSEEYLTSLYISIDFSPNEIPTISINRDFIPEKTIQRETK